MAANSNLHKAKNAKNDEFYTRLEDIETEISSHPDYVRQFKDKTVLCNCDDPEWSNFFKFFRLHFKQLGMKKLIATHYNKDGSPSYKLEWTGEKLDDDTVNMIKTPLKGDGDFRSDECVEILKKADIVVTNPPFSLFREYVAQLMEYNKKFIIIGNNNAISYKEFFPLIKDGKVWAGYSFNKTMYFEVGEGYAWDDKITAKINDGKHYGKVPAISWFTNLDLDKRHETMPLNRNYKGNEKSYPSYYNFDGINIDSVKSIPKDYDGIMGVPITFLSDFCPEQFEIIGLGISSSGLSVGVKPYTQEHKDYRRNIEHKGAVDGDLYMIDNNNHPVVPYARILIRRKKVA